MSSNRVLQTNSYKKASLWNTQSLKCRDFMQIQSSSKSQNCCNTKYLFCMFLYMHRTNLILNAQCIQKMQMQMQGAVKCGNSKKNKRKKRKHKNSLQFKLDINRLVFWAHISCIWNSFKTFRFLLLLFLLNVICLLRRSHYISLFSKLFKQNDGMISVDLCSSSLYVSFPLDDSTNPNGFNWKSW